MTDTDTAGTQPNIVEPPTPEQLTFARVMYMRMLRNFYDGDLHATLSNDLTKPSRAVHTRSNVDRRFTSFVTFRWDRRKRLWQGIVNWSAHGDVSLEHARGFADHMRAVTWVCDRFERQFESEIDGVPFEMIATSLERDIQTLIERRKAKGRKGVWTYEECCEAFDALCNNEV